jgi:Flp pilus assembly protein TadB
MSGSFRHRLATSGRQAAALYRALPRPLRRVLVLIAAAVLIVAGVAELVLPGPGLLVLAAALAVLALEFEWARRWLERSRSAAGRAIERGRGSWLPRRSRPASADPPSASDLDG